MAFTVVELRATKAWRTFRVDASVDGDINVLIAHRFGQAPDFVFITPEAVDEAMADANRQAAWGIEAVDGTNITLRKSTDLGSGGSRCRVSAMYAYPQAEPL